MPRKALGNDPFARSAAGEASEKQPTKPKAARRKKSETAPARSRRKKTPPKKVKLLEPSEEPVSPPIDESGDVIADEELSWLDEPYEPEQEEDDGVDVPIGNLKRRRSAHDKDEDALDAGSGEALEESESSEEDTSSDDDSSTSTSLSDEEGAWETFSQIIDLASLRSIGKTLGKMRLRGRSENVDEFGKDPVYSDRLEPLFEWLYEKYWRVEAEGVENVPAKGKALLVANHSGMLPFDGIMISEAVRLESDDERDVRFLIEDEFSSLPFLGPFLSRLGAARACQENAERLLDQDELVCVFPEGAKGTGKPFRERYRLQRFGRGGFITLCMRTRTPLIPVAVVGAEETYPILGRLDRLAKPLGLPFVPITPSFPFLGLLGLVPLPSKWYIRFGKPMSFRRYRENAVEDDVLVNKLKEQVRGQIQDMLEEMLEERTSVWF